MNISKSKERGTTSTIKNRFLNLKERWKTSSLRAHQFYSRQGKVLHLEDHLHQHAHNKRIPAITINQMKIYAHCNTSTTLPTGLGHDLQLISRVPACSLKHLDTSCSLQHIDRSTIFPAMCPLEQMIPTNYKAPCFQGYVPIRSCAH